MLCGGILLLCALLGAGSGYFFLRGRDLSLQEQAGAVRQQAESRTGAREETGRTEEQGQEGPGEPEGEEAAPEAADSQKEGTPRSPAPKTGDGEAGIFPTGGILTASLAGALAAEYRKSRKQ